MECLHGFITYWEFRVVREAPIIEVQHLSVKYDERTIIDDVSFDIREGEIFIILGASGSGKTTIFNRMIGLQEPTAGEVIIDGESITSAFGERKINLLRKIGVMYQSGALFGSMNLLENVCLPLEEFTDLPQEAIDIIALNKLQMVGLADFIDYMPAEVSGGMQRRAAIARAMALDPKILFLDEPSAGLDPITSVQLDRLIISLAHTLGITFVIVSHELPSIFTIADRVVVLYEGKIIASGDPKTLRDKCDNVYVRNFFNRKD
ncbi:MAG: polyamine ABC transporter ATP-binding protein [Coxiella sp. DG_40]|nr:MAG: polyamine ABC transporter ATP-binding protein [Coxiella sp. DG_40]